MKKLIMANILITALLLSATLLFGKEKIKVVAALAKSQIQYGKTIAVPVTIDMSDSPENLGSFTATLNWHPAVLQFRGCTGGSTVGFDSPLVNDNEINSGKLTFAAANAYGAHGEINILNVSFKVIGNASDEKPLSLKFSAMAAAKTFTDLLPHVQAALNTDLETQLPESYGLGQNYPNPFNPSTEINYQLPETGRVQISIYNMLGQQVRVLINKEQDAGNHVIRWNGKDNSGQVVPSGTYVLRMKAGEFLAERKMMLLK